MDERRACMMTDLENYSTLDGQAQKAAQRGLAEALDVAAAEAGMRRQAWERQESGDGELAVLPPDEDEAAAVGAFPVALDSALRDIHRRDGLLLRVRLGVNYGVVQPAHLGFAGLGPSDAARMIDAPAVREALAAVPDARVVLAVSAGLYRDVIKQGHSSLRWDQFREVQIPRIEGTAFISIPGIEPSRIPVADDEPSPTDRVHQEGRSGTGTVVQAGRDVSGTVIGSITNTGIQGPVHTGHLHIGPRHG
jgi:hypothetical protein